MINETVQQVTRWFANNRHALDESVTVLYAPASLVILQVAGRKSGRLISLPLALLPYGSERCLVSMLGERVSWVRNVRAADGLAVLYGGDREPVRLVELPPAERPPILKAYLKAAPGARAHIPLPPDASPAELAAAAAAIPVFRVEPR